MDRFHVVLFACPKVDGIGSLSLPGRSKYLVYSRAWACCTCSRWERGCLDEFFSYLSFLFFFRPIQGTANTI